MLCHMYVEEKSENATKKEKITEKANVWNGLFHYAESTYAEYFVFDSKLRKTLLKVISYIPILFSSFNTELKELILNYNF